MNKKRTLNKIAVISTVGMLGWLATSFLGGMYIYFLTYSVVIIPLILLYNFSFVATFVSVIRRGVGENRRHVLLHGLVVVFLWVVLLSQMDLFKSKRIITATLTVAPKNYTVVFRANGVCESEAFSLLGYKEYRRGKFKFSGDTIVFLQKPSDIRFVPDTLLIDMDAKAIYLDRNLAGNLNERENWSEHFDIR